MSKYYWMSWHQPTTDPRPLTFPPKINVLGWWRTGQRYSDDAFTLCAMVEAPSVEIAKRIILADWPEAEDWRFINETASFELGDRFPLSDWMKPRFENAKPSAN